MWMPDSSSGNIDSLPRKAPVTHLPANKAGRPTAYCLGLVVYVGLLPHFIKRVLCSKYDVVPNESATGCIYFPRKATIFELQLKILLSCAFDVSSLWSLQRLASYNLARIHLSVSISPFHDNDATRQAGGQVEKGLNIVNYALLRKCVSGTTPGSVRYVGLGYWYSTDDIQSGIYFNNGTVYRPIAANPACFVIHRCSSAASI